MECWAKPIGGCDGPMTREHLLSRALLPKEITIQGFSWCAHEPMSIGRDSFTSKHLCQVHNNQLSVADKEAVRLRDYLAQVVFRGPKAIGQRTQSPFLRLSGTLFARWLCKTHCNYRVSSKLEPNPDFVRYAFLHRPARELHFYSITQLGRKHRPSVDPPSVRDFYSDDGSLIVVTNFYGWYWIVTNFRFSNNGRLVLERAGVDVPTDSLMDRVKAICLTKSKPRFKPPVWGQLDLDWTEEYRDVGDGSASADVENL